MTKEKTLLFLCVVPIILIIEAAPGQTDEQVPPLQSIILRMTKARAANHARFRPYTVTRDYRLFGKDGQIAKSQVIADVSFLPPDQKNFQIRQAHGTGMGETVVRKMLASEVQIAGDESTEISAENYEFRFLRREKINGRMCFVLELRPKRNDRHLMTGKAWVDSETYLLQRAEGAPAKKPSWWVRDPYFALSYGEVGGMWLPTGLEATADVRIIGKCRLVSKNLGVNVGEFAANGTSPIPPRRRLERRD